MLKHRTTFSTVLKNINSQMTIKSLLCLIFTLQSIHTEFLCTLFLFVIKRLVGQLKSIFISFEAFQLSVKLNNISCNLVCYRVLSRLIMVKHSWLRKVIWSMLLRCSDITLVGVTKIVERQSLQVR